MQLNGLLDEVMLQILQVQWLNCLRNFAQQQLWNHHFSKKFGTQTKRPQQISFRPGDFGFSMIFLGKLGSKLIMDSQILLLNGNPYM